MRKVGYFDAASELRTNRDQWEAYESQHNCIVLAGPGSGKTKVLTVKLARMVNEDVRPPGGIACVTYNNECVAELRRRLDQLGVEESDRVFVGTLHTFCLKHVIGPYSRLAGDELPNPFRVASEKDATRLVGTALKKLGIGAKVNEVRVELDKFRRLVIDRDDDPSWVPGDRDLTDICVEYEAALERERLVDFDTMILTALRIVERNTWARRCLEAKFPILVVDEYQDLGFALHRLVECLCLRGKVRLFAVGDPDQSIYGFTGARPELLKELSESSDVRKVQLRLNYRCARRIVTAANAALGEERDYDAHRDSRGTIDFHECDGGIDGQVAFLVEDLLPDLLARHRAGDIVILHPTYYEGGLVEEGLRESGHEFVRLGRNAAYPKIPLTRLVEALARWCSGGWKDGEPRLSRLLRRWTGLLEIKDSKERRATHYRLVRFLFANRDPGLRAAKWLQALERDVILFENHQQRLADSGQLEGFQELLSAVGPAGRLKHFTVQSIAGQLGSPEHVNVLTLHSSKGTEYQVVVVVGADEGRLPSCRRTTADALAEQRRLFYVAVSRAKEEVHLLFSPPVPDDAYQQGPSRFVSEVQAALSGED